VSGVAKNSTPSVVRLCFLMKTDVILNLLQNETSEQTFSSNFSSHDGPRDDDQELEKICDLLKS